jgi:hypothetical protein
MITSLNNAYLRNVCLARLSHAIAIISIKIML